MNTGALVADDVVFEIMQKKLESPECNRGAVFDGFPRTVEQAEKLDQMLAKDNSKIDKVFNFEVDEKNLLER